MKNFLIKIIFVILLVLESPFHAIALPKCSGDYDTVRWTDCFGVYEWSTGFQYSGEFKDGKRHGFGVSKFPNGTKYSGKYKFGSEDGKGIYEDKEGQKHTLNYINGTPYQDEKVFDFKGEGIPPETSSSSDGNLFDTIMFLFSFLN